jgi:hypothetical protein
VPQGSALSASLLSINDNKLLYIFCEIINNFVVYFYSAREHGKLYYYDFISSLWSERECQKSDFPGAKNQTHVGILLPPLKFANNRRKLGDGIKFMIF